MTEASCVRLLDNLCAVCASLSACQKFLFSQALRNGFPLGRMHGREPSKIFIKVEVGKKVRC